MLQFNDLQAVTILRDHWNFLFWPTSNKTMTVDHDRWRLGRPLSPFSHFFCTKTLQYGSFHGEYPHGMALLCLTAYSDFTCYALVCHRKFPFLAMVYMGGVYSKKKIIKGMTRKVCDLQGRNMGQNCTKLCLPVARSAT